MLPMKDNLCCCVCLKEEPFDSNPIISCDGRNCNTIVHKNCYGITQIPDGAWFCQKCISQERSARVRCELCPSREGALKHTNKGGWCHIICGLFIPGVEFLDTERLENISLDKLACDKMNKICSICEKNNRLDRASIGACIQCAKMGCKTLFHVTCAQTQGLLTESLSAKEINKRYIAYCSLHKHKTRHRDFTVRLSSGTNIISPTAAASASTTSLSSYHNHTHNYHHGRNNATATSGSSSNSRTTAAHSSSQYVKLQSLLNQSPPQLEKSDDDTTTTSGSHVPNSAMHHLHHPNHTLSSLDMSSETERGSLLNISSSSTSSAVFNTSYDAAVMPTTNQDITVDQSLSSSNLDIDNASILNDPPPIITDTSNIHVTSTVSTNIHGNIDDDDDDHHSQISLLDNLGPPNIISQHPHHIPPNPESSASSFAITPCTSVSSQNKDESHPPAQTLPPPLPSTSSAAPPPTPKCTAITAASNQDVTTTSTTTSASKTTNKRHLSNQDKNITNPPLKKEKVIKKEKRVGEVQKTERSKKTRKSVSKASSTTSSNKNVGMEKIQVPVTCRNNMGINKKKGGNSDVDGGVGGGIMTTNTMTSHSAAAASSSRQYKLPYRPRSIINQVSSLINTSSSTMPTKSITNDPTEPSTSSSQHQSCSNMEQLLEWQWDQAGSLLMQQAESSGDIASLLSCLHDLKSENEQLVSKQVKLVQRRDHLKAVNAKLQMQLSIRQQQQQQSMISQSNSDHSKRSNTNAVSLSSSSIVSANQSKSMHKSSNFGVTPTSIVNGMDRISQPLQPPPPSSSSSVFWTSGTSQLPLQQQHIISTRPAAHHVILPSNLTNTNLQQNPTTLLSQTDLVTFLNSQLQSQLQQQQHHQQQSTATIMNPNMEILYQAIQQKKQQHINIARPAQQYLPIGSAATAATTSSSSSAVSSFLHQLTQNQSPSPFQPLSTSSPLPSVPNPSSASSTSITNPSTIQSALNYLQPQPHHHHHHKLSNYSGTTTLDLPITQVSSDPQVDCATIPYKRNRTNESLCQQIRSAVQQRRTLVINDGEQELEDQIRSSSSDHKDGGNELLSSDSRDVVTSPSFS